jgi:hypothetical protein
VVGFQPADPGLEPLRRPPDVHASFVDLVHDNHLLTPL